MLCVKEVVRKAKDEGLKIMIGGDMNAHVWELDECKNKNGKLLMNMVNEFKLQIVNCVWKRMNGPTWFSDNSEFTWDYICVDYCALKSVHSPYIYIYIRKIGNIGECSCSDRSIWEWKVKRKREEGGKPGEKKANYAKKKANC